MTTLLRTLRAKVLDHLSDDPARPPLGGVGVFHCRAPQSLHDVPIHQPLMVLVASGRKLIALGERRIEVGAGELLLLPGGCEVLVGNHPDRHGEHYLGLAMGFPRESVERFRRGYGGEVLEAPPRWNAPAPETVVAAMEQWIDWCRRHPLDPVLAGHRQVEMLLLLARAGVAGNLLLDREASWRERVAQLLVLDPAREWSAAEVCRRLHVGESTLRRHLREEGSGLREMVEETRMVAGLALLQETFWPVGRVAEAVGYRSHSRFSERFKKRFGLTPVELKRSRESDGGERASV